MQAPEQVRRRLTAAIHSLQRLHRWATYLITPVLIGHIVIAAGLPPGYRGVARAMHLGGRLPLRVAERVWPGWLDRQRGVHLDS